MRFLPAGSRKDIGIEIHARSVGKGGLSVESITAAVFAVTPQEGQAFQVKGKLPPGAKPLEATLIKRPKDKDGWNVLWIRFPRTIIPSGKELAIPALVRYSDGWIYVRFYRTGVPAPLPVMTPEQMKQRAKLDGKAPPKSEDKTPPAKTMPAKAPPAKTDDETPPASKPAKSDPKK